MEVGGVHISSECELPEASTFSIHNLTFLGMRTILKKKSPFTGSVEMDHYMANGTRQIDLVSAIRICIRYHFCLS